MSDFRVHSLGFMMDTSIPVGLLARLDLGHLAPQFAEQEAEYDEQHHCIERNPDCVAQRLVHLHTSRQREHQASVYDDSHYDESVVQRSDQRVQRPDCLLKCSPAFFIHLLNLVAPAPVATMKSSRSSCAWM